jgi:hypothetical protein
MFSGNARNSFNNLILQALELGSETTEGKYLGLPTYIGRSKDAMLCVYKRENTEKDFRMEGATHVHGSKKILIKAVTQAIPTYAMA